MLIGTLALIVKPISWENKINLPAVKKKSHIRSNEAFTPLEAHISSEAPIPPFILPSTKDFFIKFMKIFIETT